MTDWLRFLPIELAEVTELADPQFPINDGDEIIGDLTDDEKRAWVLCRDYGLKADRLRVDCQYEPLPDKRAELVREVTILVHKSRVLQWLLWVSIYERLDKPGKYPQIGVRAGFKVVGSPAPPVQGFGLGFGQGEPE